MVKLDPEEEILPEIDDRGAIIGYGPRYAFHNGSRRLHPVVHLHVFSPDGRLYLQRRSLRKTLYPGRWDCAVGGHISRNETVEEALTREAMEELGIYGFQPEFLGLVRVDTPDEAEMAYVFRTVTGNVPRPDGQEVIDVKALRLSEIRNCLRDPRWSTPQFMTDFFRFFPVEGSEFPGSGFPGDGISSCPGR